MSPKNERPKQGIKYVPDGKAWACAKVCFNPQSPEIVRHCHSSWITHRHLLQQTLGVINHIFPPYRLGDTVLHLEFLGKLHLHPINNLSHLLFRSKRGPVRRSLSYASTHISHKVNEPLLRVHPVRVICKYPKNCAQAAR